MGHRQRGHAPADRGRRAARRCRRAGWTPGWRRSRRRTRRSTRRPRLSPAKAKAFFGPTAESRPEGPRGPHEADGGRVRRLGSDGTERQRQRRARRAAASTWTSARPRRSTTCRSRSAPARCTRCSGPNGAGKSTLVKILAGVTRPTAGTADARRRGGDFKNGHEAVEAGIATVSQELNLFPDLSVLENLFLRREPLRGWRGGRPRDDARVGQAGARRGRPCPHGLLDQPLRSLSLGGRQLVEIARALLEDPRVLILDEPTSALKAAETQRLLDVVRQAAQTATSRWCSSRTSSRTCSRSPTS